MVTEPTHIDGGVLDLVLTDDPDIVGVQVGSPVATLNNSAVLCMLCLTTYSSLGRKAEVQEICGLGTG